MYTHYIWATHTHYPTLFLEKKNSNQKFRAGNFLIAHRSFAHFAQIKWATVSHSLRLLKTNVWLWVNRSGHSYQKSKCKRIAQVAHQ